MTPASILVTAGEKKRGDGRAGERKKEEERRIDVLTPTASVPQRHGLHLALLHLPLPWPPCGPLDISAP